MKNYRFIISGKVQGVYYRVSIKNSALKSNYKGYVKNLPDGNVEAGVTCEESKLNDFIEIKNLGAVKIVKLGYYSYNSQDVPDPYFFWWIWGVWESI